MIAIDRRRRSPNFAAGRQGHRPEAIVQHITEGSAESALSWLTNPTSKVSAHYLVSRAGEVYNLVDDSAAAWHAGRVQDPTWTRLKPGVNPNLYTIGVEHEGKRGDTWTGRQLLASAELQYQLCVAHEIPIHRDRFPGHRQIFAGKTCPDSLDIDTLFGAILTLSMVVPEKPLRGERRWSPGLSGWVYLSDYIDDSNWHFVTDSQIDTLVARKAGTRWSRMPAGPERTGNP